MEKRLEAPVLFSLFFYSGTTLALEVFLMRYFSAYLWDTLGAMVISVALLGFGVAGPILFKLKPTTYRFALIVCGVCLSFFVSTIILFLKYIPFNPYLLPVAFKWWIPLIGLYGVLFIPFLSVGVFTGLVFKLIPQETGRVYAYSLVGAGLGVLCIYGLFQYVLPEHLYTVVLIWVIVGSLCLFYGTLSKVKATAYLCFSFVPLLLIPFYTFGTAYDQYKDISLVRTFPNTTSVLKMPTKLGTLEMLTSPSFHDLSGLFIGSSVPLPTQYPLFLNGHHLTSFTVSEGIQLEGTFTNFFLKEVNHDQLLILGAGGGWELIQALQHPFSDITAVEDVKEIKAIAQMESFEKVGQALFASNVHWSDQGVKSFLANPERVFDAILLPSQSFHHPVANVLHTVESYQRILQLLKLDGLWGLNVPIQQPPREGLRTLANVIYAMKKVGMEPVEDYLVVFRDHRHLGIWVNHAPWLDPQISVIHEKLKKHHLDVVFTKAVLPTEVNIFHKLSQAVYYRAARRLIEGNKEWSKNLTPFDVRHTSEDRPFFNYFVELSHLKELVSLFGKRMIAYVQLKEFMQLVILIQLIFGGFLLVMLPAFLMGRKSGQYKKSTRLGVSLYFSLLGIAYIAVEILLIECLAVWVFGDYISAAAFVLSGLLIASGVGAYITEKEIWFSYSPLSPSVSCIVVSSLILISWALISTTSGYLAALHPAIRTVLCYLMIFPVGVFMGMPFPTAFKKLLGQESDLWPWAYGFNGYFSVLGGPLAALLVISFGFMQMFILLAGCYALASLLWYAIRNKIAQI